MANARLRWCLSKILEAFSPELQQEQAGLFIRKEDVNTKFTQFFRGEGSNRLFIYYQPIVGHDLAILGNDNGSSSELSSELFVGEGDNHLQTRKCCYFIRTVPSGKPIDASKASEADLLFGELCSNPLSGIESSLACEFLPLFEASAQWGKTDDEQKADFMAELDQFIHILMDSRKSLVGGLELRRPDHRLIENANASSKSYGGRAPEKSPELIAHYKDLLREWCNQIEPYVGDLGTGQTPVAGGSMVGGIGGDDPPVDRGPRGELEHWRNRMQRLTSITEQLKRKDCKDVFHELSTLNNKHPEYDSSLKILKKWKAIDVKITEAANEAKDNVKYLFTLERFIEPLYSGTPTSIIDTLPALMNSIKMIHTIARYYNTNERMTALFAKITEQMIINCKNHITGGDEYGDPSNALWETDAQELVRKLELCLKLNEAYQEQYRLTKQKLAQTPKGKQFDFNEMEIFGNFDLFCRRVIKLIDMYSTIDQFNSLSQNKLEGMEGLIAQFENIVKEFKQKKHGLLSYRENKFDRDYVEFNVRISDLEGSLQQFINQSFENITSIEHSLKLLHKFQSILQRESLKSDLDSKLNIIFQNYGMELEQVQQLYEKQKHDPPIPRNLPPVAGNITWSRHLLKRIEEPMKQFESNQNVLAGKDAKRIIKMYNKVARTLVAFEYLWYQAWVQSIDNAKAGLQATLIIRHPEDKLLYVNFDQEILQLIREAKCLDRMGIEIPESAKIALFQEEKFKTYYNDLHWALIEYDRVLKKMIPVTSMVLKPHFNDMEYKLRPGMVTLTWTSMNIDAYKAHVHAGLQKLEELVSNINDIIENRIEKNLKIVSKTLLVDLPENESFTVEEFVSMQEKHIAAQSSLLQGKNVEIQHAVEDLVKIITQYKFDNSDGVSEEEIAKLKKHYNHFMYQALLHCAKNSMNALKNRIASRSTTSKEKETGNGQANVQPFFDVDVQLAPPKVILHPSLDEIQECINKSAQAILKCFKKVIDWNGPGDHLHPASTSANVPSFFERITKDIEIVRVALLLTGCIQGIRNTVYEYLDSFSQYNWLWADNKDQAYTKFMSDKPTLDDYEHKLRGFGNIEAEIDSINGIHNIGALSLNTENLKLQFKYEADGWKTKFSDNLHTRAKNQLQELTEYIRVTTGKLARDVTDLDTLGFMMNLLREVRARESGIDMEINPIMNMYQILEYYLTPGFMEKEEIDKKTVLRSNWKKLIKQAESRTDELSRRQMSFKRNLIKDIRDFDEDVKKFRNDFVKNGPMVQDIKPLEAVERLKRFEEESKIRERKYQLYHGGEGLFALPHLEYPDLDRTNKELKLSGQLFGLYTDVINTISEWKEVPWLEVSANMAEMTDKMDSFALRCKKLPTRLREWEAFKQLRQEIDDFQTVLPLLTELSKESIMDRHWQEVQAITGSEFDIGPDFKLETLLGINMVHHKDEIEEVTEGADKQLKIQNQLAELQDIWSKQIFTFSEWKGRNVNILKGTGFVIESLEEAQMNLQTMLTMRHVTPFREEADELLKKLSDASDTLERWLKVQMMWCSLESVFTGGDIAKNMPMEAKKFAKVDKDWAKIMSKATEQQLVVECCANELLRSSLPAMYMELEKCQKSLEGYLEQKRNKFPRFYFVSNPGLLIILSQGSDPLSMNEHYEKVFDAITSVQHHKTDKTIILKIQSSEGEVPFSTPVKAVGNIEDWLSELLRKMQITMKDLCRLSAGEVSTIQQDIHSLRHFVDTNIAQFSLLGIQLMWTADQQTALEQCKTKKNAMKDCNQRMLQVLLELSSWCLQDLGAKSNRIKIETLVTIHVHQRDVTNDLAQLHKSKRISDSNDFEWLKQARFYWRANNADDVNEDGALVVSITDVDFNYQFEYLGSKERLVITPLTDRCYITLAQALGMYFGGAPAGPAGTGKTETVKDMGRTLGIFVVVTNCTDQQKYTDCAKIFKGLCQGGLWGCFDEFNRIQLPVLSVVAQQVLAITNAKKTAVQYFQFPGDPQNILLRPVCAFFITMNPGYAGRQELPENLKALFRGVAMMVPDFRIIMKVKLCSVGYSQFELLSMKFFILYNTCKEQLSAQKHYDWGLRNILAVLRTAGQTLRDNGDKEEDFLMYRTLRDMNLSKLVAQDVPLFLSLLADLFPSVQAPPKGEYPILEVQLKQMVQKNELVYHPDWVSKTIQLYETTLVRHGIMLVGPSGGGKTQIFKCLRQSLEVVNSITYKDSKLNPKAIRAQEMYGEVDIQSGEWTTGVFAAMWAKYNNRNNPYNTWIIADGPVDAIWIEDLNTVLDDNKILTLANGDRMPMTDNVKLMFEVETLVNASPATVSRAGIIFVSETDLDWAPFIEGWVRKQPDNQQEILRRFFSKYLGECNPQDVGMCMDFLNRNTEQVMTAGRVGLVSSMTLLLQGLILKSLSVLQSDLERGLEKLFLYSLVWSVGGLLEWEDRLKLDEWLRSKDTSGQMPNCKPETSIYEYFVNEKSLQWELWAPPLWKYPKTEKLDFSNLLVPTMDSTRALYLMKTLHDQRKPTLLCGGEGTAKTSTALMFFGTLDPANMLIKRVNFSSATTPFMCQNSIETELDKRGGKNFGPPNGKIMTVFIDDMSMPEVNTWGDQPTLEMVRMLVELNGFCFLDKDKRGDFKTCEDLIYVAAMGHPGGGKNDIPNRLKSKFFVFNMVLPSITSINDIYGQMLSGRFTSKDFKEDVLEQVSKLTATTITVWRTMKQKMLPTPAKFHYVFNMRELSRVFQGILLTPKDTIKTGGIAAATMNLSPVHVLINLWRHECQRVFGDKLTNNKDKDFFSKYIDKLTQETFGDAIFDKCQGEFFMVNFMRDDIYDEDGILVAAAPKVYEPGGPLDASIRRRVLKFLDKHNEDFPSKKMELVLFNDALKHLLRINRLLEMPRGSALLVGVGGSGKQSLTKLASYISRATCFQITLTKSYNVGSLMEDMRNMYKSAGQSRKQTTFLFTESEIKDEVFLETINSVLMTGEIPGLFQKDEMLGMTADLQGAFKKERPGMEETQDNLKQFFTDCVRDNLHLVLCMSPLNPKFPIRARKFPGLISGPTIDWFLPWPEEALVSVSKGFINDYPIECTAEVKKNLMVHMGMVHNMVTQICDEYFMKMRRRVYQTPKSYLSFIKLFKEAYTEKLKELKIKEGRVTLGLQKLIQGANDVEAMKLVLAEEQKKLDIATRETNDMLKNLEANAAEAKKEGDQVAEIASRCEADALRIAAEKAACEADLAKAQPFVDEAETAISSIKPAHIGEIKKLPNPADIIKLVFDGCLLLFMMPLLPVKAFKLNVAKQEVNFLETSFKPMGLAMLGDTNFLNNVVKFGKEGKDKINEETIELLCPYIDLEGFNPQVAKNASQAAEGLCVWVRAMKFYHEASKIVKPKLEALAIAEAQMEAANKALAAAEARLLACKMRLQELQQMFDNQMAAKKRIEDGALALQRKMNQASQLIGGLAGERKRWTEDANNFADLKRRLVGDCAVGCAFISYCGPFNQEYRAVMTEKKFVRDLMDRSVPVTHGLEVISFLVDVGTIGDWNMEGLPTDPLSIQNGILVTRSSRYPLLIDPQGQAFSWIRVREAAQMPNYGPVALNDSKLRDKLEFCMGDGRSMLITGVEEEIDPMLDPLLEKQFIIKGSRWSIIISDKNMDFDQRFKVFFITRLPNPNFSPELQAKVTVVDFTVTQKGLEEQLLGRVIGKEQKALEEQLSQVLEEVNSNTKSLLALDASLLERLTSNTGNLLEDEELIGVLANTKQKAAEVNQKLEKADETKISINEKREQFRPVATRGSVLYFSIVETSYMNCMYQTSLDQFLVLFMESMEKAEKATLASKRVTNIIETMTYITYRYVNRGLYEKDKLTYVLLLTLKVLVTEGMLKQSDITLFLRGGAALDIAQVARKPNWISNDAWLNVIELGNSCKFFVNLKSDIPANEAMWRRWYDDNEPENMAIPDYETKINDQTDIGPFYRLLLVRSLRVDRCILQCKDFIRACTQMGPNYVEPVTDTIDEIFQQMTPEVPVIFLLSVGADPTESIESLARKRKLPPPAVISLGEGQEPVAIKAMNAAAANGTWVLLQNCELGLGLMNEMEDLLSKLCESIDMGFRLFITALPNPEFPLGLLQMCTKVTNEPPAGLKAGLLRSYTVIVDQERLERVETSQWRILVFGLCFLHSVVQERRKFGPLGWCIPYEYNSGDLTACILFLEKHLYNGPISWPTFQYMVAEAQYGGKITDDLDRRMFKTYATQWLSANTCSESFNYNPNNPIFPIPKNFVYKIPTSDQVADYRAYLNTFPEIDSPEVFGLHPNADLTFRVKEVGTLFGTLSETQPKGSSSEGGESREDVVSRKAEELSERLPEDYIEDDYKEKLKKLGGLAIPLNIFLFQEIQRLQRVIGKVRFILAQLRLAIKGEVVMTEELQATLDAMYDARVPQPWIFTVAGDEFSWILPSLGIWFSSLLLRDEQDRTWLNSGRPNSYWLTGFFNPQGMLTAMKQEMTRKHKADKWALDDVTYHTDVTNFSNVEQVRSPPPTGGVYVHGLFLDGCAWNKHDGVMVDSEPKKLFVDLPILQVSANTINEQNKVNQEMFGSIGPYKCPCYKYPARTDRYLIFMVNLKCTAEKNPNYWVLRGACLLCNHD